MKTITQTYRMHAPIKRVWQALTNPDYIKEWSGSQAIMNEEVGSTFSLWNGDIHGKNIMVTSPLLLKQEWYGGNWKTPSYVTFTLFQEKDTVIVKLLHTDLPDSEVEKFDQGWKDYYLGPLKTLVEKDNTR